MQTTFLWLFLQILMGGGTSPGHAATRGPLPQWTAKGELPSMALDSRQGIHLTYGTGDSILYLYSADGGVHFSRPVLVGRLPNLHLIAKRGPQIAVAGNRLVIIALNKQGDIFSYTKKSSQTTWQAGPKLNDQPEVAKEGLLGVSGDASGRLFAVWLDLRNDHRNKIYGAFSEDGGLHWSANRLIYRSPEGTVCECCKPSVAIKGKHVYVMFRNWLKGNRDLYVAASTNGGRRFAAPQKLGRGSWALKGCPMDGGAIALNRNNQLQTVWMREGNVYTSTLEGEEQFVGQGRNCQLDLTGDAAFIVWTDKGQLNVHTPQGNTLLLGEGSTPMIRALNSRQAICVWEKDKQLYRAMITL